MREPNTTRHSLFETPIGTCGIAWNASGLVSLQLPEKDRAATERRLKAKSHSSGAGDPPPMVRDAIAAVQRHLAGESIDFTQVAVDFGGIEPFHRKVYDALRQIGWGRTTTYGELARFAGASEPQAAQEVGVAMARNPLPLIIPCHRVLAAGNKIGGFSAYGGALTKERLLALEGIRFEGAAPRLPGL